MCCGSNYGVSGLCQGRGVERDATVPTLVITQRSHACSGMSDVTPRDLFTTAVRHFRINIRYYAAAALRLQEVMPFFINTTSKRLRGYIFQTRP